MIHKVFLSIRFGMQLMVGFWSKGRPTFVSSNYGWTEMKRRTNPYAPMIDLTVRFLGNQVWYRVGTWQGWARLAREKGCGNSMMLEQTYRISFVEVCGRWFRFYQGGIYFADDGPELNSASLASALEEIRAVA